MAVLLALYYLGESTHSSEFKPKRKKEEGKTVVTVRCIRNEENKATLLIGGQATASTSTSVIDKFKQEVGQVVQIRSKKYQRKAWLDGSEEQNNFSIVVLSDDGSNKLFILKKINLKQ